ncbi:MAG: hypothetical protein K6A64_00060 [Bacteroidales bacterium]|nr:hypothetical protein [Bacteroidales bacterium]
MKTRLFILFAAVALIFSCSRKADVIPAFQPGNAVAVCSVGASGGDVSVLVETEGQWRLRTVDSWISTDVPGGNGRGAFTFHYDSNQSDILNLRSGRIGRIAICMEDSKKADTLLISQRGFLTPEENISVTADPTLKLEFETPSSVEVKLLVASTEGASAAAVADWVRSYSATVSVLDGVVTGNIDGLNVLGCNYEGQSDKQRISSFREAVQSSIGNALVYGNDWIVCGQMYHYSAMQVGYMDTPSWYPADASGSDFISDRFAWQNNLYDLLWMKTRGWVETYTDNTGHKWQADYVYVSASVLDKVASVDILPSPISGMTHSPIAVVLKY